MADLLTRSNRSLIRQSFDAREREEPLNGDGFGVGWYSPEIDPVPCVFTSVTPAWSNRNLYRLAEKISSKCMFAHIRAATAGSLVSEVNCHPFQFGRYLWMHNGRIAQFQKIKRRLRESLSDETYGVVQGTTDSEHAFAVFLNLLTDCHAEYPVSVLGQTMRDTISLLVGWIRDAGITDSSYLNFAVTDGSSIVVSRYTSSLSDKPESLYFSMGARFEALQNEYRMRRAGPGHPATTAIVTSEPLTDSREDWESVPANCMVQIDQQLESLFVPIAL